MGTKLERKYFISFRGSLHFLARNWVLHEPVFPPFDIIYKSSCDGRRLLKSQMAKKIFDNRWPFHWVNSSYPSATGPRQTIWKRSWIPIRPFAMAEYRGPFVVLKWGFWGWISTCRLSILIDHRVRIRVKHNMGCCWSSCPKTDCRWMNIDCMASSLWSPQPEKGRSLTFLLWRATTKETGRMRDRDSEDVHNDNLYESLNGRPALKYFSIPLLIALFVIRTEKWIDWMRETNYSVVGGGCGRLGWILCVASCHWCVSVWMGSGFIFRLQIITRGLNPFKTVRITVY